MTMLHNTTKSNSYSPGQSKTLSFFGAVGSLKATCADTNGSFGLIELTLPPHFRQSVPHWHAHTTEGFYVLDGTLAFTVADQTFTVTRCGFVLAPPRTVHHYVESNFGAGYVAQFPSFTKTRFSIIRH